MSCATIEANYEHECARLFNRPLPALDDVLARLVDLRALI